MANAKTAEQILEEFVVANRTANVATLRCASSGNLDSLARLVLEDAEQLARDNRCRAQDAAESIFELNRNPPSIRLDAYIIDRSWHGVFAIRPISDVPHARDLAAEADES